MTITSLARSRISTACQSPAELMTRDQDFALERLQGLLERRDALDADRLTPAPEDQVWLVHALDAAIVSYYRLARGLGVGPDAEALLSAYRRLGLGC